MGQDFLCIQYTFFFIEYHENWAFFLPYCNWISGKLDIRSIQAIEVLCGYMDPSRFHIPIEECPVHSEYCTQFQAGVYIVNLYNLLDRPFLEPSVNWSEIKGGKPKAFPTHSLSHLFQYVEKKLTQILKWETFSFTFFPFFPLFPHVFSSLLRVFFYMTITPRPL